MSADFFGLTARNDQCRLLKQDFILTILKKDSALEFLTSMRRTGEINFLALSDR